MLSYVPNAADCSLSLSGFICSRGWSRHCSARLPLHTASTLTTHSASVEYQTSEYLRRACCISTSATPFPVPSSFLSIPGITSVRHARCAHSSSFQISATCSPHLGEAAGRHGHSGFLVGRSRFTHDSTGTYELCAAQPCAA